MIERGWDKIYILVDLHGTVFRATYNKDHEPFDWYPGSMEVLHELTRLEWVSLILWTSTWENQIGKYLNEMKKHGILFDYIGTNPEVPDTELSCFKDKTYFNVGFDDKFGFDPDTDWIDILRWLKSKN